MIWDRAESVSLLMDSNHVDDGLEPDGKGGGVKGRVVVGNQRLALVFLMLPGALHVFFSFLQAFGRTKWFQLIPSLINHKCMFFIPPIKSTGRHLEPLRHGISAGYLKHLPSKSYSSL